MQNVSFLAQDNVIPIRRNQERALQSAVRRHTRILAEVLDVALQDHVTVTSCLESKPSLGLEAALEALPASSKRILQQRLGEDLQSFIDISKESDPELFYHKLYLLADELEGNIHDLRFAYRAYVVLADQQTQFSDYQARARTRLAVITGNTEYGKAPWIQQASFIGRQVVNQTFKDLPLLFAMGVGTSVLRWSSFKIARYLAPSGVTVSESLAELSFARRMTARLAGGATEVAAFSATHWSLEHAFGYPEQRSLSDEVKAAATFLIPMHVGGFVFEAAAVKGIRLAAKLKNVPPAIQSPWLRRVSYPVTGPLWAVGKVASSSWVQKSAQIFSSRLVMFVGIQTGLYFQDPESGVGKGWYWNVSLAQGLSLLAQREMAFHAYGFGRYFWHKKFPAF